MAENSLSVLASKQRRIARFGWTPDLPDFRDLMVSNVTAGLKRIPRGTGQFSLRSQEPEPCWDQGQLGSCTANAVAFLDQFERKKQGLPVVFRPSRLAIYYGARLLEGDTDQDAGAQIRDAMKTTAKIGAAPEDLWPYDIARFAEQPPQAYLDAAVAGRTTQYLRCPRDLPTIKRMIYNGYPVVMGFSVYESFESDAVARTGVMPMPKPTEQLLGGHAVAWMGWDDEHQTFETRNSWGTDWGLGGHFLMPYAVAKNPSMSSDFWTLRSIAA